ncbi:hypothetical protein [Micromonospora sp. URMC 103]|uniref:hypothetical protein n=1 Tax=Micromonospora sp. URMC 103 TaxID=3423406 RepID=UPI003F1A5F43
MTDAPDPRPTSTARWQQWGSRGLTKARNAGVQTGRWAHRAWERLVASLGDEAPARPDPTQPPPGPLVEHRDAPTVISVPARGYVYSFHLHVTFAWSSTTTSVRAEALSWYARYFTPHAVQRLTRLATDAARDLAPHRAAALEAQLIRDLRRQGPWPYRRGAITCQPDVSVRLDDRVREALQPHVDRLVELECEWEEHLRQVQYAERLSRRWIALLSAHLDATGADPDFADARRHMLAAHEAAAEWIDDLLAQRPRTRHTTDPPPQQRRP